MARRNESDPTSGDVPQSTEKQPPQPYDPNSEKDADEKESALRWELLRRNPSFGVVARRWVEDSQFRLTYAESDHYYNLQIHFHRCALDWMIPGLARVELAQAQLAKGKWLTDTEFNFGPIVAPQQIRSVTVSGETLPLTFRFEPLTNPPPPLRVEQPWPDTSQQFRQQFILAVKGDFRFQAISENLKEAGIYLRWAAARVARNDTPQKIPEIADTLFTLGDHIFNLAEFHQVFALPNVRCPPATLQQHIESIRKHYEDAGLIESRFTRHASWLGTEKAWRWFLLAEQRGWDADNLQHMYELAALYSEDLRQQRYDKTVRKDAKPHGFRNTPVKSTAIANRRNTVAEFIRSIHRWRDAIYPPSAWAEFIQLPCG